MLCEDFNGDSNLTIRWESGKTFLAGGQHGAGVIAEKSRALEFQSTES